MKPYRTRINRFVVRFGERNIADVTTEEIKSWLDSSFADAVTRNNTRRVIVNFFNLANKYVAENPAAGTKRRNEPLREIGILSPQQVAALLDNSTPEILPYFVIAAFAGLRPEELWSPHKGEPVLQWSDIKWKQGMIRVRAEVAKVGPPRNVTLEPNLVAWLEPYRFAKGPVCPSDWRDLFRETRAKAGVTEWPADCLRHSFATYWLEIKKDAPALALQMGNSVDIVLRRYSRVLDEPDDAARYWNIMPVTGADKLVEFSTA